MGTLERIRGNQGRGASVDLRCDRGRRGLRTAGEGRGRRCDRGRAVEICRFGLAPERSEDESAAAAAWLCGRPLMRWAP